MSNIETESQSASPRNPVIDLEAEELSEAADTGDESPPKSEDLPPPQQLPERPFLTRGRLTILAIIVAVIAGAGLYATFSDGFWSGGPTLGQRIDSLEAASHTLNGQVNEMGEAIGTLRADTKKLIDAANTKADEASGKADAASQGIAAFETRLAEAEKNLSALRTEIAGLGTTGGGEGPSAGAIAALETRLAALEEQVKALEANQGGGTTGGGNQETAALSQALADLKAKFAGGAPYKAEIDAIAKALPDAPGLAELALHAEKGLATAESLGATLEALAPELPKSSGNGEGESGILAWLGTIITIRNLDERDWSELALAAAKDAKAGDLRAAIRRLDETGSELPAKLAEWRVLAETRLQAESALDRLSAAVIAAIAGKS
jgi:hypothetical protein